VEEMRSAVEKTRRVAVTGVLAPHAVVFREELSALGYTSRSTEAHLMLMNRLSVLAGGHRRRATGVDA
jgi:hypothetical protein